MHFCDALCCVCILWLLLYFVIVILVRMMRVTALWGGVSWRVCKMSSRCWGILVNFMVLGNAHHGCCVKKFIGKMFVIVIYMYVEREIFYVVINVMCTPRILFIIFLSIPPKLPFQIFQNGCWLPSWIWSNWQCRCSVWPTQKPYHRTKCGMIRCSIAAATNTSSS